MLNEVPETPRDSRLFWFVTFVSMIIVGVALAAALQKIIGNSDDDEEEVETPSVVQTPAKGK